MRPLRLPQRDRARAAQAQERHHSPPPLHKQGLPCLLAPGLAPQLDF